MPVHQANGRETLARLPFFAAQRFPDRAAQRVKREGAWLDVRCTGLREVAAGIGLGLIALGVRLGDRVCVLSDTRPEWRHVEFGIAVAGAVVVPIYPSSSPEECRWVIEDSGAVAVIVENAAKSAKLAQLRQQSPELRLVLIEAAADRGGGQVISLEQLRVGAGQADDAELIQRVAAVQADDPALIVYTSGTTGRPKGCVLTHRNMTASCRVTEELEILGPDDVTYLFLPLPRIFEKVYTAFASQGPPGTLAGMATGEEGRRPVGESRPDASRGASEQVDTELFAKARAGVRWAAAGADLGGGIDRTGDPRALPRRRSAGARRIWSQRVGWRGHVQHPRRDQDRDNRPAGSGYRDPPRRRRRDHHARTAGLRRVLEQPGGHRGGTGRWVAVHR